MIEQLYEELIPQQQRMHRKSKKQFREYLFKKAEGFDLQAKVLPKTKFAKNVVVGDIKKAKIVIGAHYDTPPRMFGWLMNHLVLFNILILLFPITLSVLINLFVPSPYNTWLWYVLVGYMFLYILGFFAIANKYNFNDNTSGVLALLALMAEVKSDKVAYVFFDNEEKGLIGSYSLARYLKKQKKKYIVLDCIGRGDVFALYHYQKPQLSKDLDKIFSENQEQSYQTMIKKGGYLFSSDHMSFRSNEHVGILGFNRLGKKIVIRDIHSHRDKDINLDNIRFICDGIKKYIGDNDGDN